MNDVEPPDHFDEKWPHALGRELDRIPLPPRRSVGRYAMVRARRRGVPGDAAAGAGRWPRTGLGFGLARPLVALAVLVVVAFTTTVLLDAGGLLPFSSRPVPDGLAQVKQQQNNRAPLPASAAPIEPSLAPIVTAPVGVYHHTWAGTPAAPQAWTPGAVNDWDLLATSDVPADRAGSMQARFGPDCAPPPATHPVRALADSAFICANQLMTAIEGGGDGPKTYAGVYLAPAQLADFSGGASTITWQVSTLRSSANDWWDVWLTPFATNLVAPVGPSEAPAFNGAPADAVHIRMNNGTCPGSGQPALGTANNVPIGTIFNVEVYAGGRPQRIDGPSFQPCLETAVGRVAADSAVTFRLDVARDHVRFVAQRNGGGAPLVFADAPVSLPFSQAVLQFAHHSLDPEAACGHSGACGPNTYRWSNVSIDPAVPFTMLRPAGGASVHGATTTLRLPQPAPAAAHLRFYGFGSLRAGFNGAGAQAAVPQDGQRSSTGEASYWMPVPAGTTTIALTGSGIGGRPWWVFDVSVWAPGT